MSLYRACARSRMFLSSGASNLSTLVSRQGAPAVSHGGAMTLSKPTRHFASSPGDIKSTPSGAGVAGVAGSTDKDGQEGADAGDEDENMLEGKKTRDNIHSAFSARSCDAVRYDYFAQRAELECETDAAPLFRSLAECSRQQAMGYLELMEEYGDTSFAGTMANLDVSAAAERKAADSMLRDAGKTAAAEDLEHCEEWFDDMADAAHRAATRIEQVHHMLEEEIMASDLLGEVQDEDDDGAAPSKQAS